MTAPDQEKRALRRRLREVTLPPSEHAALSAALCACILASEAWRRADCVAAFVPLPEEADIRPLLRAALATGRLALPATLPDRSIVFRYASLPFPDGLVPDAFGIPAPPESSPTVPPEVIGLMLMPLTACDRQGHRLGKGAGCYDRWLADHPCGACRMGIALPGQLLDRVPADAHDIPLHCIATPEGILTCDPAAD